MKNQLTLLHFDNAEDLIGSIDMLQQHNIIIREIYSAESIPGIEAKLRIRELELGNMALRYGCLGGIALTSFSYCFLQPQANWEAKMLNTLLLVIAFLFASRLFPGRVPKLAALERGDKRYLMIVDARCVPFDESIAHLFQYTRAVEISPAIKSIIIS